MEKSQRNHTSSRHIWRDGTSKLKGHGFGFLEKSTNCTQVLPPNIINMSTYVMNMGWQSILPLKIYSSLKTWKEIAIFLLNVVISNCRLVKNHPNVTLILHLCGIA
jgi:hypothetical protein